MVMKQPLTFRRVTPKLIPSTFEGSPILKIPLTHKHYSIIDKCDGDLVRPYTWWLFIPHKVTERRYAAARVGEKKKLLHSLIMNTPKGMEVDHINRNGLDNRRCNLRLSDRSDNNLNARKRITTRGGQSPVSKYKGVSIYYKKIDGSIVWITKLYYKGICLIKKISDSEKEAALAYDECAKKLGSHVRLNFPAKIT
jgi:hypothetical protein